MTDTNTEPKKKLGLGKGCLIVFGAFVGLGVIGQIVGGGSDKTASAPTLATAKQAATEQQPLAAVEEANNLTPAQRNAARSGAQYVAMSGFSRDGLIAQLSSSAGDGYDKADATAAVDSLDVNWNEQAARSAKQYLDMSGFSCKGLIQQLSARAGDKYTVSQATYGAKQAGAC